MPLHLQSIMDDNQNAARLTAVLRKSSDNPDSVFVSRDKHVHSQYNLSEEISGNVFGRLIFTMKVNDEQKRMEIIDIDAVLNNNNRVSLDVLSRLDGIPDSSEYYGAVTAEDVHLKIEAVNRFTVEGDLANTKQEVSVSAFPFQATVYDDIEAFNQWAGFGGGIKAGDTDFVVHGFSETFMMPGGILGGSDSKNENYTFLLGKVASFQNVRWKLGKEDLDFVLVWLDTALGRIPAAMGPEVFDLSKLAEGKIIAMNADIKGDLSKPEDFVM